MNRDELCLSVYPLTLRDGGGGDGDGGGGGGDGDGDGGGCTFRIGEGRVWACASPSSLVDDILNMLGGATHDPPQSNVMEITPKKCICEGRAVRDRSKTR